MNADDIRVWLTIAIIPCIVAVLWVLCVILCREWVKSALRDKICQPLRVRWRPFDSNRIAAAFVVVYSDFEGRIHRATCRTPWHRRSVEWIQDEIVGSA